MTASNFTARRQPFFYLLAAFLTGILGQRVLAPPRWLALLALLPALLFAIHFVFSKKALAATLFLLSGFVCLGGLLAQPEKSETGPDRLLNLFAARSIPADEAVELTGVLVAPPEPAPQGFYLDVEAESLSVFAKASKASGRARLAIWFDDKESAAAFEQLSLDYGSRLRVAVKLERANTYKNPGAIDFNEFLERQGYDLKGTIKSPLLVEALGRAPVSRFFAALYHFRLQMLQSIDARFQAKEAGTLKAMMLGNRYFLDTETSDALRQSATFHTLVISGMHFGLLAFVLLRISLPLRLQIRKDKESKLPVSLSFYWRAKDSKPRRPSYLRFLLAFAVLWAYALMVGLAPPVTRAVLMISIGLIAPLLFRQAASLNTLALAAFLMLAWKPLLVADPGFQLSFLAVAAIVVVALPLAERLRRIGRWRPTSVTPHPPSCARALRALGEILFWDERAFQREMRKAPITYHLDKSQTARLVNRLGLQWLLRSAALLLITSTAIQLLTLPLMVVYFNRVAPIGILLNIFSGLLTGVLMLASLLALWCGAVNLPLAAQVLKLSIWTVKTAHYFLVHSINPFLHIAGMTFRAAHYQGWQAGIYALYFVPVAALVVLLDLWEPVRSKRQKAQTSAHKKEAGQGRQQRMPGWSRPMAVALMMIMLLSIFAVTCPPLRLPKGRLTVYFLDVGQGDAALVVFPQGATMLIDGGGQLSMGKALRKTPAPIEPDAGEAEFKEQGFSVGEVVVSRFLWSLGLTKIDYLLATHADADHIQGLATIARNFRIGEALVGRLVQENAEFAAFVEATGKQQTPLAILASGERFEIQGATLEVLWPLPDPPITRQSRNNDSLVLRLSFGENAILMTGDIEREAEASLLKAGGPISAEVMKVPHHGSKTSSSERFLDEVRPRWAIVSVGERSRFGHPHQVVVERYRQRGIRLLQTGRDGMICVQSDGQTLRVTHQ